MDSNLKISLLLENVFGLNIDDRIKSILNKYNIDINCRLMDFDKSQIFSLIKDIGGIIIEKEKNNYELAKEYYGSIVTDNSIFFDIGFTGSAIEALFSYKNKIIDSYYFIKNSYKREEILRNTKVFLHRKSTSPSQKSIIPYFIEIILSSFEGTCLGFRKINNKIVPIIDKTKCLENTEKCKKEMQDKALNILDNFLLFIGNDISKIFISNENAYLHFEYSLDNLNIEDYNIFDLEFSDFLSTDNNALLVKDFLHNKIHDKNIENQEIKNDKWYRFGKLSRKEKIKKIIKRLLKFK